MAEVIVVDASVGVKWFRDEPGSSEARELVRRHAVGDLIIAADHLFLYEVLAVIAARRSPHDAVVACRVLRQARLSLVPPAPELVEEAATQAGLLGCSLYDAFSVALATILGAPLYSADRRAHATVRGAVILDGATTA